MNKKLRTTILALTLVTLVGAYGITKVSAAGFGRDGEMSTKLAQRFGLNEGDVTAFFQENRNEMHEQREIEMTTKLDESVANGTITEAQKTLILEHHEEVEAKQESFKDLDPEARREAMQGFREEMRTWAEDNGIDMQELGFGMRIERANGGHRGMMGR